MLQLAQSRDVPKRLVFVSSNAVVPTSVPLEWNEDEKDIDDQQFFFGESRNILSMAHLNALEDGYGETKWASEYLVMWFASRKAPYTRI